MSGRASFDTDTLSIVVEQTARFLEDRIDGRLIGEAEQGEWPAGLWSALAELGLPMAFVAQDRGGIGIPPHAGSALLRLLGARSVPLPIGETMLANRLWTAAGGDALDGPATLAPSQGEGLVLHGGSRLDGVLRQVPWGRSCDHVLAIARDEAGHPCLVAVAGSAADEAEHHPGLGAGPRDTLLFRNVELEAGRVLALGENGGRLLMRSGAYLRAQQMVGAMQTCLALSLRYVGERVQFGRTLSKFQAIQQMLAQAAGEAAAATAAADLAARHLDGPMAELAVAVAKARAGEAAGKVAAICHQAHGAMGFTWEYPLQFSTRRLMSWRDEFGAETAWQDVIGRLVCAGGADQLWRTVSRL